MPGSPTSARVHRFHRRIARCSVQRKALSEVKKRPSEGILRNENDPTPRTTAMANQLVEIAVQLQAPEEDAGVRLDPPPRGHTDFV
jgi:hypothetical protein